MAITLKHPFTSAKADGTDSTLVQPSNWNAEHTFNMATNRILGRATSGTGAVEELTVDGVYDFLGIIGTTAMFFAQEAAPTGWTKSLTHNNKALRLVTGTSGGAAGGTTAFTTVFGSAVTSSSTVLTEANLPAHTHGPGTLAGTTNTTGEHKHRYKRPDEPISKSGGGGNAWIANTDNFDTDSNGDHSHTVTLDSGVTASTGSGTGHTHTTPLAVQYVDVILATKD